MSYLDNINFSSTSGAAMPTNVGDKKYAQNMRAYLAREQWADYQRRFQPIEDQLIDAVTGTEMLDKRLSAISVNNQKAFDAAAQDADLTRQRYGIQQTDQQRAIQTNMDSLAAARSDADARNNIRAATFDRNMAAVLGSGARSAIDTGST